MSSKPPDESERSVSRRAFLGGAGAAATLAATGVPASASLASGRKNQTVDADVVIVGAGLAGLTAARDLRRAGKSVVVLEARERVGGRVHGRPIGNGEVTEVGAEFIGPTQDRIAALAKDMGVKTFLTYDVGDYIYYRDGMKQRYSSQGPLGPVPPDPTGVPDAQSAIIKLDQMATEIPVDKPWKAPNAAAWDSQTFQTWIDDNTSTDGGKFLLSVATKAIFSAEPRDLSLLYAVYYMAAAGNEDTPGTIERLVSTTGGAQMHRFVGGSQRVPERLAKKLGDAVHLGVPVSRIVQERGRVRVVGKGLTAVGKRVVVAIPPPLAARIEYHPGLPAARDQLTQRFTMGSVMKVIATYDKPFWRDDGLAGQVVSDTGPVQVTFDNTPHGGSPGTLMGFIEADDARSLDAASHQSIEKQVLANFVTYFGEPAADAERFLIQRWDEQIWSRGGPVSFAPPGLLLSFGRAIRKPVGRIHWAGTETSDYWTGYMDGAVRSGERVAKEIVKALA